MSRVCESEKDLLKDLPVELREDIKRVWSESIDEKKYILKHKYSLGLLIKKATELEESNPDYRGTVAKIQKLLNISSKRVLDRVYRFVTLFTAQEIRDLTKSTSSGFCITWSHFDYVMVNYLDKDKMLAYLNYARKYGISPFEMYQQIRKDCNRMEEGHRKRKAPTSSREFCNQALDYLNICETRDSLLSSIPTKVIDIWKQNIDKDTMQSIITKLENHLVKCYMLKEQLCK